MLWQFLILSMTYYCSTCQVLHDKKYFDLFILLLFVHFRYSHIFKLANWRPVYQVENFQLNKNLISKNNFDSNCFGGIQLHLWYFSSIFFVGKINIYIYSWWGKSYYSIQYVIEYQIFDKIEYQNIIERRHSLIWIPNYQDQNLWIVS